MTSRPLISIGLPVYNAACFLEDTLRSIFAQTYTNWELVVIDDGSTDGSTDIVRSISDERLRVLPPDGSRRGLAVRLNQIAAAARGEYLARMDSDDLIHPRRFEAQLSFLQSRPDIDVVGCSLLMVDARKEAVAVIANPREHTDICSDPVRGVRLAHATMMASTEWFRSHPYEERNFRCEDWRLLYASRQTSRFANLPDPLYFYRVFESFSLAKYVAHKLRNARLWWELPREECGWRRLAKLAARSCVDVAVYTAGTTVGLNDYLIARRGINVTDEVAKEFRRALDIICAAEIPRIADTKYRVQPRPVRSFRSGTE